ncbi:cytochrome P450 4C1 [Halyomorpha halys]|uniref:cytochrome P450 4C1 n=1 Tax=Halyomorpha halys TaxID=286706 RepID=UPI0006D4DA88|nr:cytochrome P450 4C1 [Halyomorpha halys]
MDVGWAWPYLILGIVLLWIYQYYTSRSFRLLNAIPASKAPRFLGHTLDFITMHPNGILSYMCSIFERNGASKDVLALWTGPFCFVYLRTLSDIEKLLSDNHQLRKAINYSYLEPWLGQGLINSDGPIWQSHRKMITSSFHFKILEGFLEIMYSKLEIFSEVLEKKVGTGYFDIEPLIANYSLDVITETAMSTNVDAQRTNSEFVECIKSLTEVIIVRSVKLMYFFQPIFNLSAYKKQESKSIDYVKDYMCKILQRKRIEAKNLKKVEDINDIGTKEKLALLDMLLQLQFNNAKITDKEMFDEVNTFMFAGHDTVSSALSFVIYTLAVHQDVQEKVYAEIIEKLHHSNPTYQALMNLKYLERVIKETMRLYPSVPFIGRRLKKEMPITGGHVVPKDVDVAVFIYNHHRNPENFPDPEKFDPDRFLPENVVNRHPYAYIPFSAGSRNCIGQKFAMMELFASVSHLLRQFRISLEPGFVMKPIAHIVLRPNVEGVRIRLDKR